MANKIIKSLGLISAGGIIGALALRRRKCPNVKVTILSETCNADRSKYVEIMLSWTNIIFSPEALEPLVVINWMDYTTGEPDIEVVEGITTPSGSLIVTHTFAPSPFGGNYENLVYILDEELVLATERKMVAGVVFGITACPF